MKKSACRYEGIKYNIFKAKAELFRKGELFISKTYEWAQMWLEGKSKSSVTDLYLKACALPHIPFPTISLLFLQCRLLIETFFCIFPTIRLTRVKQQLTFSLLHFHFSCYSEHSKIFVEFLYVYVCVHIECVYVYLQACFMHSII